MTERQDALRQQVARFQREVQRVQHDATRRIMAQGRTREKVSEATLGARAMAERTHEGATARTPEAKDRGVQCRSGCAFCCELRITTNAVEVLHLAHVIRTTWPEAERRALVERLAVTSAKARGQSGAGYVASKIRCALLSDDGTCSAYGDRPLSCRGWTSRSRQVCRKAVERPGAGHTVPADRIRLMIYGSVGAGVVTGLAAAGLASDRYELQQALQIALTQDDALGRWLIGEDVFGAARVAGVDGASPGGPPTG